MLRDIARFLQRGIRPSLADVVLASVLGRILVFGQSWAALLGDGDTGWHIRTGEWIIRNRRVPTTDLFSFSRSGEPWFAWEWLSDVLMAAVHARWALAGVAVLGCCVIVAGLMVLFRHMVWRGANVGVAYGLLLAVVGASSVHYLARPHVGTLLFFAVSMWIVELDRRRPGPVVWLLVPIAIIWANLHGGFLALPASLAALTVGFAIESLAAGAGRPARWSTVKRYSILTASTAAASLVNPYGFGLHHHLLRYLSSDFIRNAVTEFQSPSFRSPSMLQFEILLAVALLVSGSLLLRTRVADALLILLWGHMALGSVRHVPIFAIAAAPIIVDELTSLWAEWASRRSARSAVRILWDLAKELAPSFRRFSLWAPVLAVAVILATPPGRWCKDFPESRFPVSAVNNEAARLETARVFTSDQWGDYLIYRGWPRQKVFIDGRSDFYGSSIGNDYISLMNGRPGWDKLFHKYDFNVALLPREWPLVSLLERDPAWRRLREDKLAVLYERVLSPSGSGAASGKADGPERGTVR